MSASHASVDDFPDHAHVLTVVATYQEKYGAMPWPLLVDVVASLPSIGSPLALAEPFRHADSILMDIVTDLRSRGLLEMTASGAVSTRDGHEYLANWTHFIERKRQAGADLAELRFERFRQR